MKWMGAVKMRVQATDKNITIIHKSANSDMWMYNGASRWGQALDHDAWQCFLMDIRDCIKEWLLCFYCPSLSPSLLIGPWDVEYVSVVLFCYILDVMLCYVWKKKQKKLLITKTIIHK